MASPTAWWTASRRRANAIVGVGVLALVGVLVVVGIQLHDTQSSSRERVISRFRDRAQVISALTQALLSSAASPANAETLYGGPNVSTAHLDRVVAQQKLTYAAVLDARSTVIAASSSMSAESRARTRASSVVAAVQRGAPFLLSDVNPATGSIDLAVRLDTPSGRRVLVVGFPTASIGTFIATYLQRVPTRDGTAFVLDRRGQVVGARDRPQNLGHRVQEAGLLDGLRRHGTVGRYGKGGYFVAVDVPTSTWRVVLTASESSLFQSVNGSRKWLPWVLYVALAIAALGFLVVLRRLLGRTAALSRANADLASSNVQLESTNALLRHAAELARSNAELEQFASIASHDLQEPLRKVQTFAAQLSSQESERLSEQGQDYLQRMSNAAGRMRALIDDLLLFSRVSTNARPFVPVDLNQELQHALVDLELRIEETGAQLTIDPLPTIDADPLQMRQLLLNLVGNALKFRREGVAPEIVVRATTADGLAELTIGDNGLGFEPEYASRIFRAFERLHGSGAYAGTGIGLALCRKIVERHHGTITATGEPGAGATFTIILPMRQRHDASPAPTLILPDTTNDEIPHVLA